MKRFSSFAGIVAVIFLAGCQTPESYVPLGTTLNGVENHRLLVLVDSRIQYSVACPYVEQHILSDGHLSVTAWLRNRENHGIQIQANCVFKDVRNTPIKDDESGFQIIALNENATNSLHFTSRSPNAANFTLCLGPPTPQ